MPPALRATNKAVATAAITACAISSPPWATPRTFHRLRIGIGHPGEARQVVNYVLGRPGKAERTAIDAALDESSAPCRMPSPVTGPEP